MTVFRPNVDGIRCRRFKKERAAFARFLSKYKALMDTHHSANQALLEAYRATHKSKHGVSTSLSAHRFFEKFSSALNVAEKTLDFICQGPLHPFASQIETIEEVANDTDPHGLIIVLLTDRPRATNKQQRIWDDAQRNMIIALVALTIELNDPPRRIGPDLRAISALADRQLFTGKLKPVWIVTQLDKDDDMRVRGMRPDGHMDPRVFVFSDPGTWRSKCEALCEHEPDFPLYVEEHYDCLLVETEELRYYVRRVPRRKRDRSRIIKFERRGTLKDSRGWKYVLVGVQGLHGGSIRLATRDEVGRFVELTRARLWTYPLVEVPDTGSKNRSSHARHWDKKIVGFLVAKHDDQLIAGPAEQIVTTLADFFSTMHSRGGDAHLVYEGRRVCDDIAPVWFSHRPINWKSRAVRDILERHWRSQLSAIPLWTP